MIARDIVDHLGLAENLVAHHLKQLHLGGWVVKTRAGREVTYQLRDKAFFEFNRLFEDTPFEKEVLSKYFR
jgi:DNA-binding transcriptional regulator PaaX